MSPKKQSNSIWDVLAHYNHSMIAAIAYKIAFYFTAVTVKRGTISVGGVQNSPNSSSIQEA